MARTCARGSRTIHAALHDRRGDHENDEQHERDIDQRCHIDVGVERQLAVSAKTTTTTAAEESCHQIRPSRASVPTISWQSPRARRRTAPSD